MIPKGACRSRKWPTFAVWQSAPFELTFPTNGERYLVRESEGTIKRELVRCRSSLSDVPLKKTAVNYEVLPFW